MLMFMNESKRLDLTVALVVTNKASWLMLETSGELFIISFTRDMGRETFLLFNEWLTLTFPPALLADILPEKRAKLTTARQPARAEVQSILKPVDVLASAVRAPSSQPLMS